MVKFEKIYDLECPQCLYEFGTLRVDAEVDVLALHVACPKCGKSVEVIEQYTT